MKRLISILATVALIVSCGGNGGSSKTPSELVQEKMRQDQQNFYQSGNTVYQPVKPGRNQELCPICGGAGSIKYMPGDYFSPSFDCPGCKGDKVVSHRKAKKLRRDMQQSILPIYGGSNLDLNQGSGGSGKSAYQIEMELRKLRSLLEDNRRNLEKANSPSIRMMIQNNINDLQRDISKLEQELIYAR